MINFYLNKRIVGNLRKLENAENAFYVTPIYNHDNKLRFSCAEIGAQTGYVNLSRTVVSNSCLINGVDYDYIHGDRFKELKGLCADNDGIISAHTRTVVLLSVQGLRVILLRKKTSRQFSDWLFIHVIPRLSEYRLPHIDEELLLEQALLVANKRFLIASDRFRDCSQKLERANGQISSLKDICSTLECRIKLLEGDTVGYRVTERFVLSSYEEVREHFRCTNREAMRLIYQKFYDFHDIDLKKEWKGYKKKVKGNSAMTLCRYIVNCGYGEMYGQCIKALLAINKWTDGEDNLFHPDNKKKSNKKKKGTEG